MSRRRLLTWLPTALVLIPALVLAWLGFRSVESGEQAELRRMDREIVAAADWAEAEGQRIKAELLEAVDVLADDAIATIHRDAPELGLEGAVRSAEQAAANAFDVPDVRIEVFSADGTSLYPLRFAPNDAAISESGPGALFEDLRREADRRYFAVGPDAAIAVWHDAHERFTLPAHRAIAKIEIARLELRAETATAEQANAALERLDGADRVGGVGRPAVLLWVRAAMLGSAAASERLSELLPDGIGRVPLTLEERQAVRMHARPLRPTSFDIHIADTDVIGPLLYEPYTVHRSVPGVMSVALSIPKIVLHERAAAQLVAGSAELPVVFRQIQPIDMVNLRHRQVAIPFLGRLGPSPVYRDGRLRFELTHAGMAAFEDEREQRRLLFSIGVIGLFLLVLQGVWLTARAVKRERDALALRDEFIQNVTHEVRTPLTSVLMHAEMLADDDLAPERKTAYGRVVEAEGARLAALIDDLLDFAALERGQRELEPEPLDLVLAVERAVAPFLVLAERDGVDISVDIPEGEVTALADPHAVSRILANLIGNAWKHGRPSRDGAPGRIRVVVRRPPEGPGVAVVDDGFGIPPSERDTVFERFGRGRDAGGKAGAGLGLALSRDLARSMGGDLDVVEVSGETVFRLRLKDVGQAADG